MAPHAAAQSARQFLDGLGLCLLRRSKESRRMRAEFARVNTYAGSEPVRPELSGLALRAPVSAPRRPDPPSRRQSRRPSEEHRRRSAEIQHVNQLLRQGRFQPVLPPILIYGQEPVMAPERLQPFLREVSRSGGALRDRDKARDLRDLEMLEMRNRPRVLGPLSPEFDQSYFLTDRPLLPRSHRPFRYWTWHDSLAYAPLVKATQQTRDLDPQAAR